MSISCEMLYCRNGEWYRTTVIARSPKGYTYRILEIIQNRNVQDWAAIFSLDGKEFCTLRHPDHSGVLPNSATVEHQPLHRTYEPSADGYNENLRSRVLKAVAEQGDLAEVAKTFGLSLGRIRLIVAQCS